MPDKTTSPETEARGLRDAMRISAAGEDSESFAAKAKAEAEEVARDLAEIARVRAHAAEKRAEEAEQLRAEVRELAAERLKLGPALEQAFQDYMRGAPLLAATPPDEPTVAIPLGPGLAEAEEAGAVTLAEAKARVADAVLEVGEAAARVTIDPCALGPAVDRFTAELKLLRGLEKILEACPMEFIPAVIRGPRR